MYTLGRLPERGRRGVRTLEADLLARREHEDDLMFERGAVQVAQRQQLCGAADAVVERTARRPRACEAYELLGHGRSEEHTSELQSQSNLVCRLLLEKKK